MKTRILCFIFSALMASSTLFAQLQVGFGGGILMSGVESYSTQEGGSAILPSQTTYESRPGFQFHLPVQYKFSKYFALQTELSYMRHAYSSRERGSLPDQFVQLFDNETLYRNNVWSGSMLARLSTGGSLVSLHLVAGPTLGFMTTGNKEMDRSIVYMDGSSDRFSMARSYDVSESNFNQNLFGLTYGGGLTFGLPHYDLVLEARQFRAFDNMRIDQNIRMSNWSVNATILFTIK